MAYLKALNSLNIQKPLSFSGLLYIYDIFFLYNWVKTICPQCETRKEQYNGKIRI